MALAERFPTLIIRLPGLFGKGLKKNVIFDFLHGNRLEMIPADGVFQFYGLDRLWTDVQTARNSPLRLVNFATEPVSVREVARKVFDVEFDNAGPTQPPRYDVRSIHAELFGGRQGYIQDSATVIASLTRYVGSERSRSTT